MNNGFLEQTRAFVAIANTGSISAAALLLGVAQPTISRQLASLEESLGRSLVHRSTRALTLTGDGQSFLPHALHLIDAADLAINALKPSAASFTGRLRVSCSHAFAKYIVIPALPIWQRLHPGLELEVGISDGIEPIVPMGLDLAIRVGELKSSNLIARTIGQFERYVVASSGYVATHDRVEVPEDLKQHACLRFFGFEKRPWLFQKGEDLVSVTVSGGLTLSTGDSLRDGVLAGLGIALTPSWFWSDELTANKVVRLLPDYQAERQKIHAVSAHRHASDSKEFAFIEFIKETFRPHNVG